MTSLSIVPLGQLMREGGGSIDPSKFPTEAFELYSIPSFDRGKPEDVLGSAIGSTKQVVEPGDVLLSKIVPHIRRAWVVGKRNGCRQIASGEWIVFRHGEMVPNYLCHLLTADFFHSQYMQTVAGVGGSLLRARPQHVARIQIPLPTKNEQRRIAAILDKAAAIHNKRRQALAEIDTLLRATFLDMFGDPRTNPKRFRTTALENVCEKIVDCLHTTPSHKETITPYPSIRTSDLQNGFLDFSTTKYVEREEYEERIVRHRPVAGDIIYSREGERLGIAALIPEGLSVCLGQRTMLFSVNRQRATPEFVWRWLNSKSTYELATSNIGGATSPHINIGDIRKFDILEPPLDDQRRFSRICGKVISKRDSILLALKESDLLLRSLSQRAFRGGL